jgi:hypothetical protein
LVVAWPHPVRAEGFNLITSPLPISVSGKPGSSITTQIRVQNGATTDLQLKVSLMKFRAYGEEGKPQLLNRQAGDDYFDWVSFNPTDFDAPPGEWKTVTMTIRLPQSAAFGYYYAVIFSAADAPPNAPQKNVIIGSSAVLVLVDAQNPNAHRSLTLANFTADHRSYEFLPANFAVRLHNEGNIHLAPEGDIFIYQGKRLVSTLNVNAQLGNILPQSYRIYRVDWKDGFPVYQPTTTNGKAVMDKHGNPKQGLKWDFSQVPKLRFGRYTAHLVLAYDNGQRDIPLEATLSFWVIPWRFLAVAIVVLVIVLLGLRSLLRPVYRRLRKRRR